MKHYKHSRTLWVAGLATVLPVIELKLQLIRPLLGEDAYSASLLVVTVLGAVFGYLRTITTGPVAGKTAVAKQVD